jgi:hypothetical protein
MERTPEHQQLDPTLRTDYINQVSLDEFLESSYPDIADPQDRAILAAAIAEHQPESVSTEDVANSMLEYAARDWARTLLPGITLNEVLYLRGFTDITERAAQISQWNEAHRGTGKEVPEINY